MFKFLSFCLSSNKDFNYDKIFLYILMLRTFCKSFEIFELILYLLLKNNLFV